MKPRQLMKDVADIKALAERLSRCPEVTKLDADEHKEAWALAHAFVDLEESFRRFLDEELPKLTKEDMQAKGILDLLFEIGEEFRHILYHIKDTKFYQYLRDEGE